MNFEEEGDLAAMILISGAPNNLDMTNVKEKFQWILSGTDKAMENQ